MKIVSIFIPPEWPVWSAAQRVLYFCLFVGGSFGARSIIVAIIHPLFHGGR